MNSKYGFDAEDQKLKQARDADERKQEELHKRRLEYLQENYGRLYVQVSDVLADYIKYLQLTEPVEFRFERDDCPAWRVGTIGTIELRSADTRFYMWMRLLFDSDQKPFFKIEMYGHAMRQEQKLGQTLYEVTGVRVELDTDSGDVFRPRRPYYYFPKK
jgi:hypothetical protein